MYKRQRKTRDCEADICFSGAYNEQMSCEAGRRARSADLRVRTLRSRGEQMSWEAGRRARSADLRVRTLRSREEQLSWEAGRKAAYKAGDALEDGQEWKAVFRPRHAAGVCSG